MSSLKYLDDNGLLYFWQKIGNKFVAKETGKGFEYKQGMDERILTEDKIKTILDSKYKGEIFFAFDNIDDREIIEEKLNLWRKYDTKKLLNSMCYVDLTEMKNMIKSFGKEILKKPLKEQSY